MLQPHDLIITLSHIQFDHLDSSLAHLKHYTIIAPSRSCLASPLVHFYVHAKFVVGCLADVDLISLIDVDLISLARCNTSALVYLAPAVRPVTRDTLSFDRLCSAHLRPCVT